MENSSELKEKPLVTITTALYNKNTDDWLDTYAESLARQTFLDKMQIIIVDNCSTDGSYEKIQRLIKKFNLPAKLYQNETNIGMAGSGKKLLKMIDTEFWAVLDPDDFYLSPRKVEKAVTFLQAHEDYSAYVCNEVKLDPNGQTSTAVPLNIPNQTIEERSKCLSGQAASTTFRSFFTSNLMDSLFKKMGGARSSFLGDALNVMLAFQFGKIFFDNSLDACWRTGVGDWGRLSQLEQDLLNMKGQRDFFEFFAAQFGVNQNAIFCLNMAWNFYQRLWQDIALLGLNAVAHEFKFTKTALMEDIDVEGAGEPLDVIFGFLKEYSNFFSDIREVEKLFDEKIFFSQ